MTLSRCHDPTSVDWGRILYGKGFPQVSLLPEDSEGAARWYSTPIPDYDQSLKLAWEAIGGRWYCKMATGMETFRNVHSPNSYIDLDHYLKGVIPGQEFPEEILLCLFAIGGVGLLQTAWQHPDSPRALVETMRDPRVIDPALPPLLRSRLAVHALHTNSRGGPERSRDLEVWALRCRAVGIDVHLISPDLGKVYCAAVLSWLQSQPLSHQGTHGQGGRGSDILRGRALFPDHLSLENDYMELALGLDLHFLVVGGVVWPWYGGTPSFSEKFYGKRRSEEHPEDEGSIFEPSEHILTSGYDVQRRWAGLWGVAFSPPPKVEQRGEMMLDVPHVEDYSESEQVVDFLRKVADHLKPPTGKTKKLLRRLLVRGGSGAP